MRIDWLAKLQHLLQTMAFSLAVATIHWSFQPERPYAPSMAYSLTIGMIIWAVIDLGRHLFASAQETGWPTGLGGIGLVLGGIVAGFFGGNFIADQMCRAFGWYANWPVPVDRFKEVRNSMVITLLAGGAGSFYFYAANKSSYLQRKMQEAQRHANEARLKLLETQLEPHMLFNTLANLRVLIAMDPPRAQQMLDHMIAYLRATLDASRGTTHPLQDEFDRLRDYLELMSVRMGPRLAYTLDLPADLAAQTVPTLLLQPVVENSIQHGLEPKVGGGSIRVSARREAGRLLLEVQDTGVGQADAPQGGKGFGLAQIRERLATLYGDTARMEFAADPATGARTLITIPIGA